MNPTVVTGSTPTGGLRGKARRNPFITVSIISFVLGFIGVALWLLPGALSRSESAVPNVVGLLYKDAASRLSTAGFEVRIGESLYHPTAPKNSVLGQTPAPSVKGLKGDEVLLDVSLGARKATVPDVVGLSRSEAVKALEEAGFDVSNDAIERLDRRPRGEVIATLPRSGVILTIPAEVRLSVSAGPDAVGVPSLVGMTVDDALALIGQLGLIAGPLRDDTTGTQPLGHVSAQRPGANAPVAPGSTVTLTVSRATAAAVDTGVP